MKLKSIVLAVSLSALPLQASALTAEGMAFINTESKLQPGWVAHVHQLQLKKGVETQPPGHSMGSFVLTSNPFDLSAHKQTELKFWKQPAGYRLEALFTATLPGWYTFITEVSVPPTELRYGRKHQRRISSLLYAEHTFSIDGEQLLTTSVHPNQAKNRPGDDLLCGWTEQQSASIHLEPGHYKAELWLAARGSYRIHGKQPRKYTLPPHCPGAAKTIKPDSNTGDEIPLKIFVRRPGENAPQPALASDFAHIPALDPFEVPEPSVLPEPEPLSK